MDLLEAEEGGKTAVFVRFAKLVRTPQARLSSLRLMHS